ncbi:CAP domain-containing protein [Flammula alnicola]|nr:CAP domain-containing protein [Flammula alnicola]
MARLALFFSLGLALYSLPSALAGPACARKYYKAVDCVSKCQSRWGWTGSMMNTDPWGSVVQKTDTTKNWDAVIAQACGVTVTSTEASTSSASTASPTETVIPPVVAAAPTPTLPAPVAVSPTSISPFVSSASAVSSSSISSSRSSSSLSLPSVRTLGLVASTRSISPNTPRPTTAGVTTPKPVTATREAQPTTIVVNTPPPSGGSGSTSSADIQAYLEGHNSVRAQHGATSLTWSDNLASKAQEWANNCVFQHSGGQLGPFGENLAAGTGSSYGIATAIKSWTDEVSQYDPNNQVPSHFTQVVWKGTTQVGCAVQSCSGIFAASFGPAKFFVCEYSPQGNIIGEFAQNVQV